MTGLPARHARTGRLAWSRATWRHIALAAIAAVTVADMLLLAVMLHLYGHDTIAIPAATVPFFAVTSLVCWYYAGAPEDHPIHGTVGRHTEQKDRG